jgi:hypothetical protein
VQIQTEEVVLMALGRYYFATVRRGAVKHTVPTRLEIRAALRGGTFWRRGTEPASKLPLFEREAGK